MSTEAEKTIRLVGELDALDAPLVVGPLAPLEALQLAGLLQLARRHPKLSPMHDRLAGALIDTVRAYFVNRPTVLEVLAAGDKAENDT